MIALIILNLSQVIFKIDKTKLKLNLNKKSFLIKRKIFVVIKLYCYLLAILTNESSSNDIITGIFFNEENQQNSYDGVENCLLWAGSIYPVKYLSSHYIDLILINKLIPKVFSKFSMI